MNAKKNKLQSVMQFNGKKIAFEEIDGKVMVNATQMAKPFNQKPINWLKTQQAKDLIETFVKVRKITLADLQVVRRGGNNPGTWFHEDVALLFAQWLSPEFYLACNDKLKQLIAKQALRLPVKYGVTAMVFDERLYFPYNDALKALGASTRGSSSRRKKKFPDHFKVIFGRNFITGQYFDLLKGYYDYKRGMNQLKLAV